MLLLKKTKIELKKSRTTSRMENDFSNPSNKELELSLKKMMINSSPKKFIISSVILIFFIAISIPLSGSISNQSDNITISIDLSSIESGNYT